MFQSLDNNVDKSIDRLHNIAMEFGWNPAKCTKNIAERGIDFADVIVAFADPGKKVARDDRKDYGEARLNMLAKIEGRIFHVTFTQRGAVTWIISARKANNGSSGVMKKAKTRAVLIDGNPYKRKADGSLVPLKGRTDWKRLDRQTSTQVEDMAANDREGRPMSDLDWAKAEIMKPEKVAVGIKLDSDVLDWFKDQGKGYQTRINGVLRRFYEVHQASGGLDGRHRDRNGEIHRKRSSTMVENTYGRERTSGLFKDVRLNTLSQRPSGSPNKARKGK